MIKQNTLRGKIIAWTLLPGILFWSTASWWIYDTAIKSASDSYDYILQSLIESVSSRISYEDNNIVVSFPTQIIPVLREHHVDHRFYQIWSPTGELIAGDPSLPAPAEFPDKPTFYNYTFMGQELRSIAQKVIIPHSGGKECRIQIAETMTGRYLAGTEALNRLLTTAAVGLCLLLIQTILAVQQVLAPLGRLQHKLKATSIDSIKPLPTEDSPLEIRPLVSAINDLLERLRHDIDLQKRFISNAAHQLRTPLAGLKIQTELALRDPKLQSITSPLNQIKKSIDQAAKLVNKMLTLQSSQAIDNRKEDLKKCDLNKIVRDVVIQLTPLAIKNNIDLGVADRCPQAEILGQEWALSELAANLIENAINYTPPGGKVTASISAQSGKPTIIIEDNGPGIPPKERGKVFERFYRLPDSPKGGTGLGLSIVKEIATQHNATVILGAPPKGTGTVVEVSFPEKLSTH